MEKGHQALLIFYATTIKTNYFDILYIKESANEGK